jgi:hypothetical protein
VVKLLLTLEECPDPNQGDRRPILNFAPRG